MDKHYFVVSDLHGYYDIWERGLKEIGFSENDQIYVIGDAIDRGPDGIAILQDIKSRPNARLLLGNHEFMMLNSVDGNGGEDCMGRDSLIWLYYNGGKATFLEYRKLSMSERRELLFWMMRRDLIVPVTCGGQKFCLTHSFYLEGCENTPYSQFSYDTVRDIVWNSVYRHDPSTHAEFIYDKYDYTFITGHVPVQRVRWENGDRSENGIVSYRNKNLIDIDGGCAFGKNGRVKCGAIFLRLNDMEEFAIEM